jgi:hypothetical protein
MTIDQGLALTGIVIAVLIGVFAVRTVRKKRQTQRQSVGNGGIGIQSGRDTRLGQQ